MVYDVTDILHAAWISHQPHIIHGYRHNIFEAKPAKATPTHALSHPFRDWRLHP